MRYSSPVPCGIIPPHSSAEVPFTLEAQVLGEQDTVARVAVFGSEESPLVSAGGCGSLRHSPRRGGRCTGRVANSRDPSWENENL